jgi:hypothetical protein
MTRTEELRAQINVIDTKLTERAPNLKNKLRRALSNLDDFDKTGAAVFLQVAIKERDEVVAKIGNRPPEKIEEMPPR